MKVYTAQVNAHNNIIVCGDEIERNSYRIIYRGTYQECLEIKRETGESLDAKILRLFITNNSDCHNLSKVK